MLRRFCWTRFDLRQPGYNVGDRASRAVLAPDVAMMTFSAQGASPVQP